MADSASSSTTPHGSGGHVKIVIGLVIGLILGIAGNCLQKPDLGGGWVQKKHWVDLSVLSTAVC